MATRASAQGGTLCLLRVDPRRSDVVGAGRSRMGPLSCTRPTGVALAGTVLLAMKRDERELLHGQLGGGSVRTEGDMELHATDAKALPILTVDVEDLALELTSNDFVIESEGTFNAVVMGVCQAGRLKIARPGGSSATIVKLAGIASRIQRVAGALTEADTGIDLTLPVRLRFALPETDGSKLHLDLELETVLRARMNILIHEHDARVPARAKSSQRATGASLPTPCWSPDPTASHAAGRPQAN
jgi:hypothetical protein